MNYEYKQCPVCGCNSLIKLSSEKIDDDIVNNYRCPACEAQFSSLKKKQKIDKERMIQEKLIKQKEELRIAQEKALELEKMKHSGLSASEVFKQNINKVIEIYCDFDEGISSGTGIIIANNFVITNAHVIFNETSQNESIMNLSDMIRGTFAEQKEFKPLELVFADKNKDIALLHFDVEEELEHIDLSDDTVETGEEIYAIGNAKGQGMAIVEGIVSDDSRIIDDKEYILISAPVTHGNSGGPIFNKKGNLIGMVSIGQKDVASMNYAIPLKVIVDFLKSVEENEGIEIF